MKVSGTLCWSKPYTVLAFDIYVCSRRKHYLLFLFPEEDDFVRISGMMRQGRALSNLKKFPLSEEREMKAPSQYLQSRTIYTSPRVHLQCFVYLLG